MKPLMRSLRQALRKVKSQKAKGRSAEAAISSPQYISRTNAIASTALLRSAF